MTYIKDLINLPDRVYRGDFVLKLTEGVTRPEETVDSYVVTPQLVRCFDEALSLIRSSLESRSSKACYLHGSFGSGKSHFMAVLNLLLLGNSHARSIPELASVVSKHNEWTEGKKFLLVPYHMIGAENMESRVLGGYVDHIRRVHPGAPTPGVYLADALFTDARNLRETMGDEAFFGKLSEGRSNGGGGWGLIGSTWDAGSFDQAVDAAPTSQDRARLVGDLVDRFFSAAHLGAEFVDLDAGFSIISKHAQSLGYDGLILFLDELILWLATHAGDITFVNREGQKLAKLVESQTAERPIPIISFVARQRDLKELVGQGATGAQVLGFTDVLNWWEARFAKITLEDSNLPAIAEKRVLKPKDEAARQMMDEAFRTTEQIRREVMDILLTSQSNREMFRKVYPFSPALIETLVAVSFLLQRERTALKVMLQLLVEQRDRLKLGDIVPVGDLFDAISEGDEAFSEVMKVHFDNAKKLYYQKLRPLLERDNQLRFEEMETLPVDDPKVVSLRNDDRLVKTLLLSALAPNVESLRALTAGRLAALNHGTIRTPIAGREGQVVLTKLRHWAAEIGEIKIGEEAGNPTITVQLTGVDTDSIIQQAQGEDNTGNRIRKIKETLFAQLEIELQDNLFSTFELNWKATKRTCEVQLANVRELTDQTLRNEGEPWRVIIDYPFDTEGHTPRSDLARLERFQSQNEKASRIIVWIPSFLSIQAQKDLGTLVKLDHIMTGERFSGYVTHLSPTDQHAAKTLLENQRSQLRYRLINYLEGAYGIATAAPGSLDTSHDLSASERFQSLEPTLAIQPPVGANLAQAFQHLLDQALRHQFPAHPLFEVDANLNVPTLKRVYTEIEKAIQHPDGRIAVEQPRRRELRYVGNPLKLGEMHETHFVIGHRWKSHFLQKEAEHGGPMTVGKLRAWMDEPSTMGLPRPVQNLVIMVFASQTNRSFVLHGGPYEASIESLDDALELREQKLPSEADWQKARERAASIFGITSSPLLNAANVANLRAAVKGVATSSKKPCDDLVEILTRVQPSLLGEGKSAARLTTAKSTKSLVDSIGQSSGENVVELLAGASIASSEQAMGSSLKRAESVAESLNRMKWHLIEGLGRLNDHRSEAASVIVARLKEAFQKDEYAIALGPAVAEAEEKAARLLADVPKTPPPRPPEPRPPVSGRIIAQGNSEDLSKDEIETIVDEIREAFKRDSGALLRVTWEVYKK
jgi:hypothetical protein